MQVKTFVAGMVDGVEGACAVLDRRVFGLLNTGEAKKIIDIKDTLYIDERLCKLSGACPGPRMTRVVIYEDVIVS